MMIDFKRFRLAAIEHQPFEHMIVPQLVDPAAMEGIARDFPVIDQPGSFPVSELTCGPALQELLSELQGPLLRSAVEEKFEIDLTDRPTMLTLRGRARDKDGRIHTDSKTKLITVLIYMNVTWPDPGGHLRLLRSAKTLDDFFAEVQPAQANAVVFRCRDNAWHGHTPFVGERRVIQLNWVMDEAVVRREQRRHGFSAKLKRWWRSERRR